jgi:ferredoxin
MDLLLSLVPSWAEIKPAWEHINLITENKEAVFRGIDSFCESGDQIMGQEEMKETSGWISWYPLLDYTRCTACGQCADFCLFGVYEKSGDGVRVVFPEGCKNNCPACGRICPSTAIVFPKYKHGGAIGGSEVLDEEAEARRQAQDVERILGEGDIYAALEKRKARRRSIVREEAMNKALTERQKALDNISRN